MTPKRMCPRCRDGYGWVCESHPDRPFDHDDCGGAGVPCPEPGCELSLLGTTPGDPEARRRMERSVEAQGGQILCSAFEP